MDFDLIWSLIMNISVRDWALVIAILLMGLAYIAFV